MTGRRASGRGLVRAKNEHSHPEVSRALAVLSAEGELAGVRSAKISVRVDPGVLSAAAEQCCQKGRRRELLNDVLIFLTAREEGATLVSTNVSDMDLLLRFRPDVHVLLYRQAGAS